MKVFHREYKSCSECTFCEWVESDNAPGPGGYCCQHEDGKGYIMGREASAFHSFQHGSFYIPFPEWCPLKDKEKTGVTTSTAAFISNLLYPYQFVLGLRKNTKVYNNVWAFPGGKMEYGETPEQSIRREVFEETGIVVKRFKLLTAHNEFFPEIKLHFLTLIFVAVEFENYDYQIRFRPVLREPEACEKWDFFSVKNIPENSVPWTKEVAENPLIRDEKWRKGD